MIIFECEQRSPEWINARLGKLTASRASDMLATIKNGEAAARRHLRVQLVLERLTQRPQESRWESQAMRDGIEREPDAIGLYEALTGLLISPIGFVQHDALMAGCSPDGVVGDFEGLVSVKAPMAATHAEYLKSGTIPGDYLKQIIHELWITGASWCDWLSYHPDFPGPLQSKLVRVLRKHLLEDVDAYERAARTFLAEVDAETEAFHKLASVSA